MQVSNIKKYIPCDLGQIPLDENNNLIPPPWAKRIDLKTAKSPYQDKNLDGFWRERKTLEDS